MKISFSSEKMGDCLIVFPEIKIVRKYFHVDSNVDDFSTVSESFCVGNQYSPN